MEKGFARAADYRVVPSFGTFGVGPKGRNWSESRLAIVPSLAGGKKKLGNGPAIVVVVVVVVVVFGCPMIHGALERTVPAAVASRVVRPDPRRPTGRSARFLL